jgi:hypothetical protein
MYDHIKRRHTVDFSLAVFHARFLDDLKFNRLYAAWIKSGFQKQLKPSLDRTDCRKPYTNKNTTMMTWAENRFKQSATDGKRGRKPAVLQLLGDKIIDRFASQRQAVKALGILQGNLSSVLNGKREHIAGYKFIYEHPGLIKNDK